MKKSVIFFFAALIFLASSCLKKPDALSGGNKIEIGNTVIDTVTSVSLNISTTLLSISSNTISQHGHCYSIEEKPDIEDTHTELGPVSSAIKFTSEVTGLTRNTKYYLRSYFTYGYGVVYGPQIEISTLNKSKPSVITAAISGITIDSAKCEGNVTADNDSPVTNRGFCWAKHNAPALDSCLGYSSNGTGTGIFTHYITGLQEGTTYYVIAYAINELGIGYGEIKSFITVPIQLPEVVTSDASQITNTSAISGGNVTNAGLGIISARGVCWSTLQNPTIANTHSNDGSGLGSYTSSITSLEPNTLYFIRAFATNQKGTSYGAEKSFKTLSFSLPQLTTSNAINITSVSASSGGNVTSSGGATITGRGICWSSDPNPTIANTHTIDGSGTGSFTSNLTSLVPNTLYYIRAYATNSVGTAYGNEVTFTTLSSITLPTITTFNASNITKNTATSGGNVTSSGGATVTLRGVCWSTSSNPTIANSYTNDGSGTGSFTSYLSSLIPNTLYYVRAFATNSAGTAYGNQISFTTQSGTQIVDYIYDDGIYEQGWIINPGYSVWLGNEFPVTTSGTIKTVKLYFLLNANHGNSLLHIDFFNQNHQPIGNTTSFTPPTDNWISVNVNNVPFAGKFYAMVHWDNVTTETNWLAEDLNGTYAYLDLAWQFDGLSWVKMSTFSPYNTGVFLIRIIAEIPSSNEGTDLFEIGPLATPEIRSVINPNAIKSIRHR